MRLQKNKPCDTCNSYSCWKKNCGVEKPMKLNAKEPTVPLSLTNLPTLIAHLKEPIKATPYRFLLGLIAVSLDTAGAGQNIWLSLGKTRAGDAYLITIHTPAGQAFVAGENLLALAGQCQTVLEASEMT